MLIRNQFPIFSSALSILSSLSFFFSFFDTIFPFFCVCQHVRQSVDFSLDRTVDDFLSDDLLWPIFLSADFLKNFLSLFHLSAFFV